jgi:hypothetical protein
MMRRKSQAALEFIMTYGWAILVVLVAIGALAYFGVLSPDRFLPAKCTLQAGLACLDHKATIDSLQVRITNSLGYDITVNSVKAQLCICEGGAVGCPAPFTAPETASVGNGASVTYTLVCTNSGSTKYNGQLNITYTNLETNIQHINQGQVTSRIE